MRRDIATALIAIAAIATGCTSVRPMMAPSGAQGFKVWCELPSQCYERAAQTCPYGYNIEANEKDYLGFGDIDGNLFISCKSPSQSAAQVAPQADAGAPAAPAAAPAAEPDPAKRCDACQRINQEHQDG